MRRLLQLVRDGEVSGDGEKWTDFSYVLELEMKDLLIN